VPRVHVETLHGNYVVYEVDDERLNIWLGGRLVDGITEDGVRVIVPFSSINHMEVTA
jgi:hypothetical protein